MLLGDHQPSCSRTDGHDPRTHTITAGHHPTGRQRLESWVSPEAHIPLCRSLALKDEHTLLEHLRFPEVLTQNYHYLLEGVTPVAVITTGPTGRNSSRNCPKDLMMLLDGGEAGPLCHLH